MCVLAVGVRACVRACVRVPTCVRVCLLACMRNRGEEGGEGSLALTYFTCPVQAQVAIVIAPEATYCSDHSICTEPNVIDFIFCFCFLAVQKVNFNLLLGVCTILFGEF